MRRFLWCVGGLALWVGSVGYPQVCTGGLIDWRAVEESLSNPKSSKEYNHRLRELYQRSRGRHATATELYAYSTAQFYFISSASEGLVHGEKANPTSVEYRLVAHQLLEQYPRDASAYISLARFVFLVGEKDIQDRVISKKRVTRTIDGKEVPVLYVQKDGTETRKRVTELFEKARKLNPDHPLVLAYFSGRAKDNPVESLRLASLELDNATGIVRLDALKRMALACDKLGKNEQAETYRKQFDAEAQKYGASIVVKLLRREGTFLVY